MIDPSLNIDTDRSVFTEYTIRETDHLPVLFEQQTHKDQFPRQMFDDLLHRYNTHHTNKVLPMSDYITGTKYPEQDYDLLGEKVILKYRNQYWHNSHDIVNGEDKYPEWMSEVDKADPHDILEGEFYVLRADKTEPYKMVSISTDFKVITIHDYRKYIEDIDIYPVQFKEFISISVFDQYPGEIPELMGVTLRADNGEPCNTVIAEFLANNEIRIVLGDECFSKLFDYYPFVDYNAATPSFDPSNPDEYIDINGYYPKYFNLYKDEVRDEIIGLALRLNQLKVDLANHYSLEPDIDEETGEQKYDLVAVIDGNGEYAKWNYNYDVPGDTTEYVRDQEHNRCYKKVYKWKKIYHENQEIEEQILQTELTLQEKLSDDNLGGEVSFEIIDGGLVDLLHYIYTKRLTDEEIIEVRKNIFKENKVYGTDKYIGAE